MATVKNRYKKKQPDEGTVPPLRSSMLVNNNIMGWFSHYAGEFNFRNGLPISFLPQLVWLIFLGIIYIGIKHDANRTIRQVNQARTRVEDLKVDFTTLKADYMYASKQTEVVKKVQKFGLEESKVPMYRLKPREDQ